jgi:hypothetical protein
MDLKIGGDVRIVSEERLLTVDEIIARGISLSNSVPAEYVVGEAEAALLRQARATKAQRGRRVERDGVRYDSVAEMRRYDVLLEWQRAGIIEGLLLKPSVRILDGFRHPSVGHVRARNWEFDFAYQQIQAPGLYVWEDYKGRATREWEAALPFRLYALRDRHVFVNRERSGWYKPAE